jgi:hypothetical protein
MSEEFARLDAERMNNPNSISMNRVVYDCIDPSPFYENPNEPYIDENDLIDIGGSDDKFNKYNFGPMNSNTY